MAGIAICVLLLIMTSVLAGCSTGTDNIPARQVSRSDSIELVKENTVKIELDGHTTPWFSSVYYKNDTLYYHNSLGGRIEMSDWETGKKLPGYIRTKEKPYSFNPVSGDSVYIMALDEELILLYNASSTVTDTVLPGKPVSIMPGGQGQPYIAGDKLIYVTTSGDEYMAGAVINRRTGAAEFCLPYPEIYKKYYYGDLLPHIPYSAFNPSQRQIVVGFPADRHLYVLDIDSMSTETYDVPYSEWKDLRPLSRIHSDLVVKEQKKMDYFRESMTYANILYDGYRNIYYRIVELPTPMPGTLLSLKGKKLAVMILDDGFNILGETIIEDETVNTFRYTAFVSEEGLNIQLISSEDEAVFATYRPEPKQRP